MERETAGIDALRLTLTGIALERHRLANDGRLPDSLEALVPGFLPTVLEDPFDGQPLRYRKLEDGCVVWSIGMDRQENQGDLDTDRRVPKDQRFRIAR